jgi:hypothetical protein
MDAVSPALALCIAALQAGAIETHARDLAVVCPETLAKAEDPTALVALAIARYHAGMFLEATKEGKLRAFAAAGGFAERATKQAPKRAEPWFWLGAARVLAAQEDGALAQLGALEGVREAMTKSLELDAAYLDAGALRVRGRILFKAPGWPLSIGDDAAARKDLEKAVALAPEARRNLIFLAELVAEEDGCAKAKPWLERAKTATKKLNRYEEAENDRLLRAVEDECDG